MMKSTWQYSMTSDVLWLIGEKKDEQSEAKQGKQRQNESKKGRE